MTNTPEDAIIVSRSHLYHEVWAEPVRTVAQRYHISDVALAKACRRHRIPVPPRGHWAKLNAGHRSPRPSLPRLKAGERDQITIQGARASREQIGEQAAALLEAEAAVQPKIEVPDQLLDPHPHVAKVAKSLRGGRTGTEGKLLPRARPRLDLRVTESALDRALRIVDALVKALEGRGYRIEIDGEGKYTTSAIVHDERLFFFLEEKTRRIDHEPTPEERRRSKELSWSSWPRYDFLPTGILQLRIVDTDYLRVRTVWADGKNKRVEDCLNDFVAGIIKAAEAVKRRRAERVEQGKQRQEEQRQWVERERLRRLDEARAVELDRQIETWGKVERIRAYVERARGAGKVYLPTGLEITTLQEWLNWAGEYADRIDPFRQRTSGAT